MDFLVSNLLDIIFLNNATTQLKLFLIDIGTILNNIQHRI